MKHCKWFPVKRSCGHEEGVYLMKPLPEGKKRDAQLEARLAPYAAKMCSKCETFWNGKGGQLMAFLILMSQAIQQFHSDAESIGKVA